MFVKYLLETIFFDNGRLKWENFDKFSLEGTSPPLSCVRTPLILVLI